MASEKEVSSLLAKIECYESCVEQLRKEIPIYFTKHSKVSKQSAEFAKALRKVASLEPNNDIQTTMFLCAQKYENLEQQRKIYDKCQIASMNLLDVAKSQMILPAKVRIYVFGILI